MSPSSTDAPMSTRIPRRRARSTSASNRRVLPTPASPATSTTCGLPCSARSNTASSRRSSNARPMNAELGNSPAMPASMAAARRNRNGSVTPGGSPPACAQLAISLQSVSRRILWAQLMARWCGARLPAYRPAPPASSAQSAEEPGAQDRQDMDGLHGLGVVQPLQHLHLPAEGLEFGASVDDRAGEAHVHTTPTLAVVDFVRCAHKAQARTADLCLGGAVVEPLQRLVQRDELARLRLGQRHLHLRPVRLTWWLLRWLRGRRGAARRGRAGHRMGRCGDAQHLRVRPVY